MNLSEISNIASHYQLGKILAGPSHIHGKKSDARFWFKTPKGEFSIKVLKTTNLDELEKIAQSELIAKKINAQGIETSTALLHQKKPFYYYNHQTLLIYPWILGLVLPDDCTNISYALQAGKLLAKIHALKIKPKKESTLQIFKKPEGALEKMDLINQAYERYQEIEKTLHQEILLSHGNFRPSNIVWRSAQTPVILDWEHAGMINPAFELIATALNWSDQGSDEACFKAVISQYQQLMPLPKTTPTIAMAACLGSWLNWIAVNEKQKNTAEVLLSLTTLEKIHTNSAAYQAWYRTA